MNILSIVYILCIRQQRKYNKLFRRRVVVVAVVNSSSPSPALPAPRAQLPKILVPGFVIRAAEGEGEGEVEVGVVSPRKEKPLLDEVGFVIAD